jgi:hypothetical protein
MIGWMVVDTDEAFVGRCERRPSYGWRVTRSESVTLGGLARVFRAYHAFAGHLSEMMGPINKRLEGVK